MKEAIKKILPDSTVIKVKNMKNSYRLNKYYKNDLNKFKKGFTIDLKHASESQLGTRLIFHAHALEKGFSHENFRNNFGSKALHDLSETINYYNESNFNKKNLKYKIALSSIHNYINIHEENKCDTSFLEDIFQKEILEEAKNTDLSLSGIDYVQSKEKNDNKKLNFKELAQNRHSVREYSLESLDNDSILSAIEIAMKTPSVCNRQPSRVYLLRNQGLIDKILKIQAGYTGFGTPPALLLVTAKNSSFIHPIERNEGFIDGGLFSMSLLYALEYEGLGACALNAMMSDKQEKAVKDILSIEDEEVLIMFITVGRLKDKVKVPKSKRLDPEMILREYN